LVNTLSQGIIVSKINKISIIALILSLTGCAGISFCNEKGEPKGCHKWDPATTAGAASR